LARHSRLPKCFAFILLEWLLRKSALTAQFAHLLELGNAVHYHLVMAQLMTSSALTNRYQTTIPEPVRAALQLQKLDRIDYAILDSGDVLLSKATTHTDPLVSAFLQFLEKEIATNPARLQPLSASHVGQLAELLGEADVDLDAPLNPDEF
jgi:antitoxin PrlF